MKPIVLGIPWLKAHPIHMEHITEFYAENKHKFHLVRRRIFYRALHQAQGAMRDMARGLGASYILFIEDDQWGYPIDGLEVLLEADKDVIGFKSYFKKYPYLSMAFQRKDDKGSMIDRTAQFNQLEGVGPMADPIQRVDLLSWAFTLVKMSVFDKMDEAGVDPFRQWGPVPTDSFFCHYCEQLGIERYVHFGATIGHGDIGPNEIPHYRRLHESMRSTGQFTKPIRVALEDDFGHIYGAADYVPEAARVLRKVKEDQRNAAEGAELREREAVLA